MYIATKIDRIICIDNIFTAFVAERGGEFNYPGETHNFWEMVYVSKGIAGFTADERVFECAPGTVVFHKPNEFHRIWSANKNGIVFTVISFSVRGNYCSALENKTILLDRRGKELMKTLQEEILSGTPIPNNFITNELRSDPLRAAKFCNTLELLLYDCAEGENNVYKEPDEKQSLFIKAVEIMQNNLDQPIKVREIADRINVSMSQIKRIFKNYALMGAHEYFVMLKMEKAKSLLSSGETVCSTAHQIGFYNQNHFSSAFKKRFGISPGKYAKNSRR